MLDELNRILQREQRAKEADHMTGLLSKAVEQPSQEMVPSEDLGTDKLLEQWRSEYYNG